MKPIFKVIVACTLLLALSTVANAENKTGGMDLPPYNSSPELQRIKSLAGRWATTTSMFGKKNQRMFTEYQVTADGSAVLERIFPGTPQEMVSVYYDDDHGKLAMTHYCILHNRPTLKLASSTKDAITLRVAKISGPKSKEHSMGDLTIVFKDKNHFAGICSHRGKGKESSPPMTMEYTRVKK